MTEFAREYGDGLYALCAEEQLEAQVLSEMQSLRGIFRAQPDFIRLLSNMQLSKQERVQILDGALRGQVHPYVLNFLKILCERGALHEYEGCENAFREDYNRAHGVVEAGVTTSEALSEAQRRQLLAKLSELTGREVHLTEKIDPAVIGGVLLEMDGQRYDNTVRHRLEDIRRALTNEN